MPIGLFQRCCLNAEVRITEQYMSLEVDMSLEIAQKVLKTSRSPIVGGRRKFLYSLLALSPQINEIACDLG